MRIEQEPDEVPVGKIVAVTVVALVVTVLGVAVAWGIKGFEIVRVHPTWTEHLADPPAEVGPMELSLFDRDAPGLALAARQRAALGTFGWIDREQGVAHIPIDAAMRLYLERQAAQPEEEHDGGDDEGDGDARVQP